MKGKMLLIFMMIVMIASSAMAAEAEHAGGDLKEWAFKVINFAILVFIIVKFLGKPIKNYFAQRKELIEKSIRESQEAKELAQKALQEVEEKLKLKDKEVQDILDTAKKIGEQEKIQIVQESEKLKEKILEQAKTNIEFEVKMAKDALRLEAAELAIQLSEQKLKEKITPEEQEKLLQESIKIIEGRKN
ncbi:MULTISPECIES: F0F1 ATP synthase subunit B [Thermodesulfovibrio]|uniref:F0F1 ATP synthase subunit B n=1 Tax=Thermodesulfovibrio TaxID=28261 RepID=UPI000414455A|nr:MULTISPECIES: F0F1 ATP synthase subunit B [Thermodesulfovibrio]MBC7189839.1 F0F1 ATP synthase subunit B [Candidatus Aerophobetes bacterium]